MQISPRTEELRRNVLEKKRTLDKERLAHSKYQVERDLSAAGDKRREKQEQMREKLRKHINKVEEVRKEQAIKRKESSESLKQMIEQKLD